MAATLIEEVGCVVVKRKRERGGFQVWLVVFLCSAKVGHSMLLTSLWYFNAREKTLPRTRDKNNSIKTKC